MKSKINYVLTATIVLMIGSCITSKINVNLPPISYEDFKTFSSPRTSYSPGYVFRIADDNKDKLVYVTQLKPISIATSDEAVAKTSKNWKTTAMLKFLGLTEISGSASNKKEATMELSFSTGKREQLSENDINGLLNGAKIDMKAGSKYYVVSETVAFTSINYKLINYNKLDVDVKAQIEKLEA